MADKKKKRYEIDLYNPIKEHFTNLGFVVNAEVMDCDVTALKDDELIIIELKLSLSIELLIQASKRQRLTEKVYIAIPKPSYNLRSKKWKDICHLMRRLELGLITVSFSDNNVHMDVVLEPDPFDRDRSMRRSRKRRTKLVEEIQGRFGDYNVGGSHKTKLMTAYKENCIQIACYLKHYGPLSARNLRELGTGEKTYSILYDNHYSWFEKIERGIYSISERGLSEYNEIPEITNFYMKTIEEHIIEKL
ncbi:DUF2161 domain-containing phosphodiesterase [Sporosarcina siberiensis]|uniref:DUF2161 domain-containing phosphodiesterase n=1 Tax=Sporosarcina siberiensis TaxID=1365606 RepID=A0ABW4SG35_9BACL